MNKIFRLIAACGVVSLLCVARAHGVVKEDLAGCVLPHGELLLPHLTSPEGVKNGYILRFSDGRLGVIPPANPADTRSTMEVLRSDRIGDALYSQQREGSLWVITGKIADLGPHFLHEVAATDLPVLPDPPATQPATPGTVQAIQEGHVYLLGTTDAKFALVRVLRKQDNGALIQYVYQPDGSEKFAIPKGMMVALPEVPSPTATAPAPAPAPAGATTRPVAAALPGRTTLEPAGATVLTPVLSTHLRQRADLIAMRLEILKKGGTTEREILNKSDAIEDLGVLRASEAVPVLIDQISFLNPRAKMKAFAVEAFHPAVRALIQIGKPASTAALAAIAGLRIDDTTTAPADPLNTTEYRLRLLVLVVRGVEGEALTDYLLNRDAQGADAAHRLLYEQGLKYVHAP